MDRTQRTSRLGRIEYGRFLRAPATLDASHAAFAMNRAGPGHVDLATHFSTAVGLGPPRVGLSSAQQLLAAGTPFVYLTLTNDHQRPTEKAHDATLKWSRTLDGASGATVRLIGPPGMFVVESYRKKMLCRMSEDLAKLDPALRASWLASLATCLTGWANCYLNLTSSPKLFRVLWLQLNFIPRKR